ncbi:MAG: tetraacyldisaccharide 4'-kinase [Gemmatimonadaceae bacterium]|nr:tetraacyldisaccharide 4'-kinase [Gemmatimonadaceae bacterium]
MRLIERVWHGDTIAGRLARAALLPLEGVYRGAVALRGELYDRGLLPARTSDIAVVSVGNLTVGGTGKTPVSAWLAARLAAMGFAPAIVLRGYGDDEPLVHARLNPGIPVVVGADRSAGITQAAARGANVAILDDAFQHRRTARDLDIVLVSADDWNGRHHLLPAGPYREPLSGLSRASIVVITHKAASEARVAQVERAVRDVAGGATVAVAKLTLGQIVRESPAGASKAAETLAGKRVLAVAAVGNPAAFFVQLESLGARVDGRSFPDHHAFTRDDVATILETAATCDYVICTLKDAVKLGPLWPAGNTALWYVSLAVGIESGGSAIDRLLMRLRGRIDVN